MNILGMIQSGVTTAREIYTIQQLVGGGIKTISELAVKGYLSTASLTDIVDKLEDLGFVERHRDRDDRRKIFITLTKSGHELLQE